MAEKLISFGEIIFDAQRGALSKDGKPLNVSERATALLAALIGAVGQAVSKQDLMAKAWPGMIVEEGNLTVQIAALRKVLGPTPDGLDWIITVPRVGYRLLQQQSRAPVAVEHSLLPSLAVLPFQNLSGDHEQDYFADGVVEDIITALSRFKSFAVIARNSSFSYKSSVVDARQVASDLGVRYVMEGSVRRAGERLRISCQLVDAITGLHLWAEKFDGALDDVFDFQDQITERTVTLVAPHIQTAEIERCRRERPGSVTAYDVYLQAAPKILAESVEANSEAYALLTHGLVLEPNNAFLLAYAAWTLEHRITMGWPPIGIDDRVKCAEFARRGLDHAAGDPDLMTHCAMALIQVAREYDWGMAVLRDAAKSNPNNLNVVTAAGVAHLHCGTVEDAIANFNRAMRLSPRDPFAHIANSGMAHAKMIQGRYEDALDWASRTLALNTKFDPIFWILVAANAQLGNLAEARHYLAQLEAIAPGVTIAKIRDGQPAKDPSRLAAILEGLRLAGLPEE